MPQEIAREHKQAKLRTSTTKNILSLSWDWGDQKKSQYIVINCKENKIVEQCFSQPAAIAIAKRMSKGDEGRTNDIMLLDQQLQKNFVDCIFYSHTIENTKDLLKREATFDRYDIAKYRVEDATAALECHIFR